MIHYITTNGIGNAWVANELREVDRAGIPFRLHALRIPDSVHHLSDWAARIHEETRSIYPLPILGFAFSLIVAPFLFHVRWLFAVGNSVFGQRESFRARVAGMVHVLVASHWARLYRKDQLDHIHAQWAHSSGTVAMYAARLLGVPFSFTGHATDLFRDRCALTDKIRRAEFIICISTFHRDFYLEQGARPEQLTIAYCGIDPEIFAPVASDRAGADGRIRVLSSGRLVEKKGFPYLVRACRILTDRGVDVSCTIGGSGTMEEELRTLVVKQGLEAVVTVTGEALKQEKIPEFMSGGDLYCLPCVWASDNDVDGLPQMLMEAMACGLPAISTRLVGIPDLLINEETGLLVEPENAEELAYAIERLGSDPDLSARLAETGREHVYEVFDIRTCLEPLLQRFREKLGAADHETAPEPAATRPGGGR